MGNYQSSLLTAPEHNEHDNVLTADRLDAIAKREQGLTRVQRRKRYTCGKNFISALSIRPFDLDNVPAKLALKNIFHHEYIIDAKVTSMKHREQQYKDTIIRKLRALVNEKLATTSPKLSEKFLRINNDVLFAAYRLSGYNLDQSAAYLTREMDVIFQLEALKAQMVSHLKEQLALRSDVKINFPTYSLANRILFADSPYEPLVVWKNMVQLIINLHDHTHDKVVLPLLKAYNLLRLNGWKISTSLQFYLKDGHCYDVLAPLLIFHFHQEFPKDLAVKYAHDCLKRTDFVIADAIDLYRREINRRQNASISLRKTLIHKGYTVSCSDRALIIFLERCHWDINMAVEQYTTDATRQIDRDDEKYAQHVKDLRQHFKLSSDIVKTLDNSSLTLSQSKAMLSKLVDHTQSIHSEDSHVNDALNTSLGIAQESDPSSLTKLPVSTGSFTPASKSAHKYSPLDSSLILVNPTADTITNAYLFIAYTVPTSPESDDNEICFTTLFNLDKPLTYPKNHSTFYNKPQLFAKLTSTITKQKDAIETILGKCKGPANAAELMKQLEALKPHLYTPHEMHTLLTDKDTLAAEDGMKKRNPNIPPSSDDELEDYFLFGQFAEYYNDKMITVYADAIQQLRSQHAPIDDDNYDDGDDVTHHLGSFYMTQLELLKIQQIHRFYSDWADRNSVVTPRDVPLLPQQSTNNNTSSSSGTEGANKGSTSDDNSDTDTTALTLNDDVIPFEASTEITKIFCLTSSPTPFLEIDASVVWIHNDRTYPEEWTAVMNAGGPGYKQEINSRLIALNNSPAIGTVIITQGYQACSRYFIHVVVPNTYTTDYDITMCIRNALHAIKTFHVPLRTVAIPLIHPAIERAPIFTSTHLLSSLTRQWLDVVANRRALDKFIINVADTRWYSTAQRVCCLYYPPPRYDSHTMAAYFHYCYNKGYDAHHYKYIQSMMLYDDDRAQAFDQWYYRIVDETNSFLK